MSNEQLAFMVKGGERDKLVELWQQVRRMAMKQAHRWAVYGSGGVELEDLMQAAFIALMAAADTYDPTAGCAFTTWYYQHLTAAFTETTGRRTEKQRRDPLDAAVSLDVPITEDSDNISLGDTIPDPGAEAAMADVDRREDLRRLHAALEAAIATLPPDLQTAIRGRYYRGKTVDTNAHNRALRLLRAPKYSQALRAYL